MRDTRFLDRSTPPHLVTLVILTGLSALNLNIFLPSLPAIAAHFESDYAVVQLTVSGYLAVTAILQLFIGPLSDRYGRRPVMLASLVVFLVATALLLIAPTIETFLAARMLQAAVVAGLVLPRAMIRDTVEMREAASALGYVTMGMSVVPMVSPAVGGLLASAFGWKSAFVATLLFGLGGLWLAWRDAGETNAFRSSSIRAQFRAFPELLRSRRFWGYALTTTFASGAFYSYLGGAPYVATVVLGLSAEATGLYFAVIAVGYMAGNFCSGRYASRVGITRMMLTGCAVAALGIAIPIVLFAAGAVHPIAFFGPTFFTGLGNGLVLPSANAGMVSVRPHLAGSASGLGGTMMIGGGALLSTLTGALLSPQSGIYPLILVMLGTTVASFFAAHYAGRIERQVARAEGSA